MSNPAVDNDNWRPKIAPLDRSTDPHLGFPMPKKKLKRPGVPSDNPSRSSRKISPKNPEGL